MHTHTHTYTYKWWNDIISEIILDFGNLQLLNKIGKNLESTYVKTNCKRANDKSNCNEKVLPKDSLYTI